MKKGVTGEEMCERERERLQKSTESRVQTCQRASEPERVKRWDCENISFSFYYREIQIKRMGHRKMVFTMKKCKFTSQKLQKTISTAALEI